MPLPRPLRPFAYRDYSILVSAMIASVFAHGMWAVAMVYQVRELGGGPAQLSVVATASSLGLVTLVLLGGITADRLSCRKIIIAVEALSLAVMTGTAVLATTGMIELWHLTLAGFLGGAGAAFFYPAYSALLPRMLPAADLLAANGVEGTMRPVLQTAAGPAAAGMIVAALSPGHAIVGIALCHLAAVVVLRFISRNPAYDTHGEHTLAGARHDDGAPQQATAVSAAPSTGALPVVAPSTGALPVVEPTRTGAAPEPGSGPAADPGAEPAGRPSMLGEMREGFAYTLATPWLKWTLVFAVLSVVSFIGPIEVLLPFIVSDRLDGDARTFGFVLAAFGIGSAVGSITTASLRLPRRYLTVMVLVWGFGTVPLAVVGFVTEVWHLFAAVFVVGVTGAIGNVIWGTLLQRRVPARMLGRISSLDFFVSLALMPVSMAVAGPLGEVLPLWVIFCVAAFASPVVGVAAWLAGRLREDEIAHPLRSG
ncbi:MFS transporter [Zhihengliuella salsuginis]|uniref:Tetracycline efflux MFS transporter Tet(V) n=1 Tax=Zhihengliuella salsuginis TaxID=578222 RepID=A0ABQ3GHY2_9MICC|nr:MFS transporter [Zhihengliuella salsuginis]GHD06638.1 tetracycline efflux MFS transporter Tet(V) [Zhihengliuella salsuginis]